MCVWSAEAPTKCCILLDGFVARWNRERQREREGGSEAERERGSWATELNLSNPPALSLTLNFSENLTEEFNFPDCRRPSPPPEHSSCVKVKATATFLQFLRNGTVGSQVKNITLTEKCTCTVQYCVWIIRALSKLYLPEAALLNSVYEFEQRHKCPCIRFLFVHMKP